MAYIRIKLDLFHFYDYWSSPFTNHLQEYLLTHSQRMSLEVNAGSLLFSTLKQEDVRFTACIYRTAISQCIVPTPLPRSIAGDLRAHEAFCRLQNGFSKIWWTVSELIMASEQSPPESSKTCGISGSSFAASFAVPAPRVTRNRIATATPFSWQPDCYTYKNIHMHIYYRNNYDTTKEKKIYQTLKTYGNCLTSVFTEQVTVCTYFYGYML